MQVTFPAGYITTQEKKKHHTHHNRRFTNARIDISNAQIFCLRIARKSIAFTGILRFIPIVSRYQDRSYGSEIQPQFNQRCIQCLLSPAHQRGGGSQSTTSIL